MFPRNKVNRTTYALAEMYSTAVRYLYDLSGRPEWVENVFVEPFKRIGDGDDNDSQWVRLRALQASAAILLDSGHGAEAVPLFRECMQITGPDDDIYYLDSMGLISALVGCGQEEDAYKTLISAVQLGIVNEIGRNDLCGQFYCFGCERLCASFVRAELRTIIIKFIGHFHGMNEAEALRLLDKQPDRSIEILTVHTRDLKP